MANYIGADRGFQYLFDAVDDVKNDIAEQYDSTATYAVGDYVLYDNILYKCITAVSTAESFDNTKWTQVVLTNQIAAGGVSDVQIDNVSVVSGGIANIPSMTGATTASAGTKGLVPAPQAGDEDKFLKGDGTWAVGGGGGSSTLANLTDVDLSSPTDGQSLVYDGTNNVWVNGDGGNANEQVLTKVQYDALTEEEKMNNTTYYITDAVSWQSKTIQPMIYSEDEREVGVWTDGKPLYQKTIIVNNPSTGDTEYDLNISNLDKVVNQIGTWDRYWDNTLWTYDINAENEQLDNNGAYRVLARVRNTTNKLYVYIANVAYSNAVAQIRFTIQYTKITDTAGSGIYTPTGILAHHYSTAEQVIGTWIDGKPLYEKTVEYTSAIAQNSYIAIYSISGITFRGIDPSASYLIRSNGQLWSLFSAYSGDGILLYQETTGAITINNHSGVDFTGGVFCIHYTKTTD